MGLGVVGYCDGGIETRLGVVQHCGGVIDYAAGEVIRNKV